MELGPQVYPLVNSLPPMLFALLPSWAKRARRGKVPRTRIAKIPPVTRLRRMAAPSFELRPQQLRASDFGVELPSPEQIFDGAEGRRRLQQRLQ